MSTFNFDTSYILLIILYFYISKVLEAGRLLVMKYFYLKGYSTDFTHSTGFGEFYCRSAKGCMKPFVTQLPQVMSHESASVETEDFKFENEKNLVK